MRWIHLSIILLYISLSSATVNISSDYKYIIAFGDGLDRVDYLHFDDGSIIQQSVNQSSRMVKLNNITIEIKRGPIILDGATIIESGQNETILYFDDEYNDTTWISNMRFLSGGLTRNDCRISEL